MQLHHVATDPCNPRGLGPVETSPTSSGILSCCLLLFFGHATPSSPSSYLPHASSGLLSLLIFIFWLSYQHFLTHDRQSRPCSASAQPRQKGRPNWGLVFGPGARPLPAANVALRDPAPFRHRSTITESLNGFSSLSKNKIPSGILFFTAWRHFFRSGPDSSLPPFALPGSSM